ncbi:MAG: aldehyde reductase [Proteobacteria bacterium]|nr:aldehyde reductase [Pseudomonadota bacterium]
METVLVTGGTGFIAQYCILGLLQAGYRVRTTVRSLEREGEVRAMLKVGGAEPGEQLAFVKADLSADAGWAEAARGCTYVMHGASPTPSGSQTKLEDWVRPAVDGQLRVLRAARDAGVKRVVLTSAFGAIGMGHKPQTRPWNETDWTDLTGKVEPYQVSKTLSERAAWDFVAREGKGLELSAINPVAVLGPVLGADTSHSIRLIFSLLNGGPGLPKINTGFVDVRDVADLHLRCMTDPAAAGERFLAISGHSLWMIEVARILRARLGKAAAKVPVREIPNLVIRLLALTNPAMKMMAPMLGVKMDATSEKAQRLLGWKPRPVEESVVATAQSLIRLGLVRVDS